MNCLSCNHWVTGIPLGHCKHPDGTNHPTTDIMVFEIVSEEDCPKQRNMFNLLTNLIRYDFEVKIGDLVEYKTILFNKQVISEVQVEHLVESGLYEHDSRLILITPKQFENVLTVQK